MAINVSFNGATIYKPGAYSKVNIDLGGGFPLSPTGLIGIFGESDRGAPGSAEADISQNVFSPEQIPQIRAKYGSGPLVDACAFLFAPATDGAIPSGAQAVYIYKTNASTRATLALANSYGTVRSLEWGVGANRITYTNVLNAETPAAHTGSVTLADPLAGVGTALGTGPKVLSIAINGAAPLSFTFTGYTGATARATLLSDLAGAFPGLLFTLNGTDKLVITQDAGSNIHRNGWGRSFEILPDSISTANATLGLIAGQNAASVEPSALITLSNKRDLIDESSTVGGNVVMAVGFDSAADDASAATVSISSTAVTLTVTGGAQAGSTVFLKNNFTAISQLVAAINLVSGWSASLSNLLYGQLPLSALDEVSSVGALSEAGLKPARIKKDASEVQDMFAVSSMAELVTPAEKGLPDAASESALSGGTLGATVTGDITNALTKFTKFRLNSIVPLFSRDATADITDGLTDAGSTYTIDGIHQAVKTHCSLMSTTKKKSERQGYLSVKTTYADSKLKSQNLADARLQLMIQDIRQIDSLGNIKFFQPWAGSCLLAGARAGSPIGTPMTFKFLNCSGIRQTAQAMTTAEADIVQDFDPDTMTDDAIQNGITFLEHPQTGGFRIVVDNTTYGRDGNWVYNRGNVLYAADVLAFDFRSQLENIFVGVKNTVKAAEVKSVCESILGTYLSQGITVSTADAPNGFKSLVVQINGNTINISVTVKLVEGIDFVLADITLQRAQNSA